MSAETGSGMGMAGGVGMSTGGGVATAAPAISAPNMSVGGERGFTPISISNAKGEVTMSKTEHTFTFSKPTPNHLSYAAVTKSFEGKTPTKASKGPFAPESAKTGRVIGETSTSQQPVVEPLTEDSKSQLHDDISVFLKGGKAADTTPLQVSEIAAKDSQKAGATVAESPTQAVTNSETQPQSSPKGMIESLLQGNTEAPASQPEIESEKVSQAFEKVVNHAEKPKGEKVAEIAKAASKEQRGNTGKSAHQDLKHELASKYVQKFFDDSKPGSESQQQLVVEQLLHKEQAGIDDKDGKLMRDINTVAEEWGKNLDKAVTVAEAYFAYLQSVQQDSPEKRREGIDLALSSLTFANQRTGVEKGAEKVIAMRKAAEQSAVVLDEEEGKTEKKANVGTITLTDTETLTDAEAAVSSRETLAQAQTARDQLHEGTDIEMVETFSDGNRITEVTTSVEDDMLVQQVIEVEEVIDTQTNEVRGEYGRLAAKANLGDEEEAVSGRQITQLMPDKLKQPEEVISQIIRDSEVQSKVDGSYVGVIDQISKARDIRTTQQAEQVIFQAIADNTAVKQVRSETIYERPATDTEKWKVLNPNFASSRNTA